MSSFSNTPGPFSGNINIGRDTTPLGHNAPIIKPEERTIKFASPDMSNTEIKMVNDTIKSRWITNGPKVRKFEKRVAEISRCDRAVAFDSCTAAMELTLRALGIGRGDEVITTPYTYSATAEVIRNVGAKIVFVDLDDESFEMNYAQVEAAITEKTKAVIPVDIGGKLCNYESLIAALTSRKDIFKPKNKTQETIGRVIIIADSAHSFGASLNGRVCGEYADFTCFSFHALKNITTGGEGGAVVWKNIKGIDNDSLETTLRLLADHGQTSRDKSKGWEYDIALFGYNSIMTDIDAAMGIAQLDRFEEMCYKRKKITETYNTLFSKNSIIKPLIKHFDENYASAMHLYPIRLPDYVGGEEGRNTIFNQLREAGIPCNVHYKPLPMMTAYKNEGFKIDDFPNSYKMFASLLSIPYHTELTEAEQIRIVNEIERVVKQFE